MKIVWETDKQPKLYSDLSTYLKKLPQKELKIGIIDGSWHHTSQLESDASYELHFDDIFGPPIAQFDTKVQN